MSLRARFFLYLALIHAVFAAAAFFFLRQHRVGWIVVEAFFVVSFVVGVRLVRALLDPVRFLQSGADLLREEDFTTRCRETGRPELDRLAQVYNTMVDRLREERIRNEERENFLQRVLETSPSGVLTLDFDGGIVLANPAAAAMLGRPAPELSGQRLAGLGTPLAQALAELVVGEARVLTLRGSRRVKCQKGEFFDRGFPRQFVLMEELTEELRRSEKAAYGKLIRMMSHEVNNTVGAVSSLLRSCLHYRAQVSEPDREDFTQALEVAIRRTDHMNQFMQRFADVVRIPPPRRSAQDLHGLVRGIVRLLGEEIARRRIRIETDLLEPGPLVACDAAQMEQVLVNVLRNAMEAIGTEGTIRVRTGVRERLPLLVVEDTGPGLADEVRRNLFAPFYTTKENGQGVGLTVVREILEAHGFEFSLDSVPGGPTRFTIVFGHGAAAEPAG